MTNNELQDRDYKWFLDNYESLFSEYGDTYLAIKNEKVLGAYSSYAEAVYETASTEPIGSFIVQHCTGDESGHTDYIASMFTVVR